MRTAESGVMIVRQVNELGREQMALSVDEQRALLTALTQAEEIRQAHEHHREDDSMSSKITAEVYRHTTPAGTKFGPRQQDEASRMAHKLWGWSMDLLEVGDDAEHAGKLAQAIATQAAALVALAQRATR